MKKKLVSILMAVVMVLGIIPITVGANSLYDPDGDGKSFAMKAEDKTIPSTDTSVTVGIDVLRNTGTYCLKFYLFYDNELSIGSAESVTEGDSFDPLMPIETLHVDLPSSDAARLDADYLWMLENLGMEDGDWKVSSFWAECEEWRTDTSATGRLCNVEFEIDPASEKDSYRVQVVPVWGNFIKVPSNRHPLADTGEVEEIFDPVGFDGIITVEKVYDPDGDGEYFMMGAESKSVSENDTSVSVDVSVIESTGICNLEFFLLYDNELSLGSADNITFGNAFEPLNSDSVIFVDAPSGEYENFSSYYGSDYLLSLESAGLENGDWKVACLEAEFDDINKNSYELGKLCTFNFDIDPVSEKSSFSIKIVIFPGLIGDQSKHKGDTCDLLQIFDPVGLEGRITVLPCAHESSHFEVVVESSAFSYGEQIEYCNLCKREIQRCKVPMTTEDFGINRDNESGFVTELPAGLRYELFAQHFRDMGMHFQYVSPIDSPFVATGDSVRWENRYYVIAIGGDISPDGVINAKDVVRMKKILTGAYNPDAAEELSADLNGDGKVNAKDSFALRLLMNNG